MINIDRLIKESMKASNKDALRAYKNLKAEIQLVKTTKNAKPYDEAAEVKLISKMCKKLEEAIEGFLKAHREDLVTEYTSEWEVLKKLLPEPVNESQICSFLKVYCFENNFIGPISEGITGMQIPKKEMGNVIKAVKVQYPQADGKLISQIVKNYVI
jgi:uncharacterized protein